MKTAHMHQSEPEENVAENGWELVVEGRGSGDDNCVKNKRPQAFAVIIRW
jgi:hypothetical protein